MFLKVGLVFIFVVLLYSCRTRDSVEVGLDQVNNFHSIFKGKRIGIVTNHTAYNKKGRHITDVFLSMPEVEISALFSPEHGIRGSEAAGRQIDDGMDPLHKIPIYSLYGANKKPTPEMLADLDLIVFDIQDIGTRFYTYIYTMALAMESAAEMNIPFVILDRPNPINGESVEGNILEPELSSFIGLYQIPVRHGMTVGELANMINEEGWFKNGIKANLTVITIKNWRRHLWFDQTGIQWRPPSPNITSLEVASVYPGTCLFEGTNISEGRGTYQPFLRLGSPWFRKNQFDLINKILNIEGASLGPITFTPISIPGMAPEPKWVNQNLVGVQIRVTDRDRYQPYLAGIALVKYFYETDRQHFKWRKDHFDQLCGTTKIREYIISGKNLEEIKIWLDKEKILFLEERQKYLLY